MHPKLFLNTGLGVGKSTLICCFSIGLVLDTNDQVVVINSDKHLLFRDYKRVEQRLNLCTNSKVRKLNLEYFQEEGAE